MNLRPDIVLVLPQHAAEVAAHLYVESEHDVTLSGSGQTLPLLRLRASARSVLDVPERFGLRDAGSCPALVKFSSGPTGAPKAVLWTAANVCAAAANVVETLGLGPAVALHDDGASLRTAARAAIPARALVLHAGRLRRPLMRFRQAGTRAR